MKPLIIALKEMHYMLREKSFALLILLELLLVSSSGLLSVGYVIMTSPQSSEMLERVGNLVYVGVVTDTRLPIEQAFERAGVHHTFYANLGVAQRDFEEGLLDAVLAGDLVEGPRASVLQLKLAENSPKTPLTKLALKKALVYLEEDLRAAKTELYASELEFANYEITAGAGQSNYVEIYFIFTLPLLLFLPCVISGSLTIDSITEDIESKRILNLVDAPLTSWQIVLGKSLGALFLSVAQAVIWLAVLNFTFISPENELALVFLCFLYTVFFMNVGSVLSLLLGKMRSAQIMYTFASMGAVSLFSPFANLHPLLLENSPSYLITRLALGSNPFDFTWQILFLVFLAVSSLVIVYCVRDRVCG